MNALHTNFFHQSSPFPARRWLVEFELQVFGDGQKRMLHKPRDHAGIGTATGHGCCSRPKLGFKRQHGFAHGVVCAIRIVDLGVVIEAGPRLGHRVNVKRTMAAGQGHDIDTAYINRKVDDKTWLGVSLKQWLQD